MYTGPIYTVIVPLQCKQVRLYVKTEFLYYSVVTMISSVCIASHSCLPWYPHTVNCELQAT